MNRTFVGSKIKLKLILCLIFSFTVSAGIFFLLLSVGEGILDSYFNKTTFVEDQTNRALSQFKSYVSDNKLTIKDQDKISTWVRNKKYVVIYIYKNNNLVYIFENNDFTAVSGERLQASALLGKPLYDIEFADTKAQMYMESFFEYKYYNIVVFLGATVSFLSFIFIMSFFINRKTSYIGMLEREIKILEGGNLEYQITIRGRDELSSLAQSINEMRKSFIERLENEDKARLANSELVTAMSHDLRTPLTALVGYLDIIEYKKYKSNENLIQYIHNSREKAYQIKHLSDKLFEYFTVSNVNEENLEMESFDGNQLIDQIINEQLFILQNNGFYFELDSCDTSFELEVNLISIRRVFDNIFSNIFKYAEKSAPVKIKYYVKNNLLFIDLENKIRNISVENGTGIGMKTCEKIIEDHAGKIAVTRIDNIYSVHISLPIKTSSL